jgi:hypothetical protein
MYAATAIHYFSLMGWHLSRCPDTSRHFPAEWLLQEAARPESEGFDFQSINEIWHWWKKYAELAFAQSAFHRLMAEFYFEACPETQAAVQKSLQRNSVISIDWHDHFRRLQCDAWQGILPLSHGWVRRTLALNENDPSAFNPGRIAEGVRRAIVEHERNHLRKLLPCHESMHQTRRL